jgi:hypothetical protein
MSTFRESFAYEITGIALMPFSFIIALISATLSSAVAVITGAEIKSFTCIRIV